MICFLQSLGRKILFGAGLAVVLFFGLAVSYKLPNEPIRRNVAEAANVLKKEGDYPSFFAYSPADRLDNFTDSIVLSVAYNKGDDGSLFYKALSNSYYHEDEPIAALEKTTATDIEPNREYTRYWFGTAGVVRFLMTFISYTQVRRLLTLVFGTLLILLVYLVTKRIGIKYAVALMASLFLMRIWIVPASLQYAPAIIISMLSMIAVCITSKRKNYQKILPYIFISTGILTAFFDLLTVPLITLGMPLVLMTLIDMVDAKKFEWKMGLKKILIYSLIWGLSYAGMYIFKWAITSIVLHQNTFKIAIDQLLFRADTGGDYSRLDALQVNINDYFGASLLIVLVMYTIWWVVYATKKKGAKRKNFIKLLPLLLLVLYPYIWYIGLSNHSFIHHWMTYRLQAIALFAYLGGTLWLLREPERKG